MNNKEKCRQLRLEGKSYKEISDTIGIAKSSISRYCKDISNWKVKVTEEIFQELNNRYSKGESAVELSKEFNLGIATVHKYVDGKHNAPKYKYKTTQAYSKEIKQKCVDYKGGYCSICGYNKSLYSLDFHHTNPKNKSFTIATSRKCFNKLKDELDKCILVCKNCHGEIHDNSMRN